MKGFSFIVLPFIWSFHTLLSCLQKCTHFYIKMLFTKIKLFTNKNYLQKILSKTCFIHLVQFLYPRKLSCLRSFYFCISKSWKHLMWHKMIKSLFQYLYDAIKYYYTILLYTNIFIIIVCIKLILNKENWKKCSFNKIVTKSKVSFSWFIIKF